MNVKTPLKTALWSHFDNCEFSLFISAFTFLDGEMVIDTVNGQKIPRYLAYDIVRYRYVANYTYKGFIFQNVMVFSSIWQDRSEIYV